MKTAPEQANLDVFVIIVDKGPGAVFINQSADAVFLQTCQEDNLQALSVRKSRANASKWQPRELNIYHPSFIFLHNPI